ncbi:hypothetical protein EUGRSUZ_H04018 [Eucalyptus grandis]|uniref:Uncharacterized protein n=2 Tax=Eucalyptus grandis TaxID=71139 RepID=A0ACC3JW74_EUCGR|nr:hypothetical protein EUGRSUZ_H04018 [Eucalyptus grandis]
MGIINYSREITSVIAPSRMFKALVLESHNILPMIVPEGIKSVEFIEGEGGVGSIKKTNYGETDSGCICKMTSEYHVKEGAELKEEDIKKGKDKAMGLFKAVEEYLLANSNVCA